MSDDPEPWMESIDPDRSTPGQYVLNGKDRKYCVDGESQGSLKKSELRSRIKNDRLQELPQRFQDLFDDLALVEYSDDEFLSDAEKENIWLEVLDVETHASTIRGYDIPHPTTNPDEDKYRFGVGLGTILREMNSIDTLSSTETDLVWGFIIGLCAHPSEAHRQEAEKVENLVSNLNEEIKSRFRVIQTETAVRSELKESANNAREKLLEILNEEGVDTDHVPLDVFPSIMSQLPDDKEDLREKIVDAINLNKLNKTHKLSNAVKSDGQNILEDHFRGDEAQAIINELWLVSKTSDNDAVQPQNINSMSSRNTGMKLINQYKSTEMHDDSVHFPVIEEANTGYRLTSYGKLVSYCFFENNGDCNWIEQFHLFHTGKQFPGRVDDLSDQKESMVEKALAEIDITEI